MQIADADRNDEKQLMRDLAEAFGPQPGDCVANSTALKAHLQQEGEWSHWFLQRIEGVGKTGVHGAFGYKNVAGNHNVVVATPTDAGYADPFVLDVWYFYTYLMWNNWTQIYGPSSDSMEAAKYWGVENGNY